jgi:hypothetical protein
MNKQFLLQMLELSNSNKPFKYVSELLLQIAVDPELDDNVSIDDFDNEFYSVRSLTWIRQCFNFNLK